MWRKGDRVGGGGDDAGGVSSKENDSIQTWMNAPVVKPLILKLVV